MQGFWYKTIRNLITILVCTLMHSASFGSPNIDGIQIYQKNIHLSEEHKQKLANDIDRYRNADNLWDVLRKEFSLSHYENNPNVQDQIQWFLHHQDYLNEVTGRAGPYLYFILQQARKRHLPAEVVLLPMIESAYNPFAYSSAGAAGIWQMMPGTASGFGIKQDWWYDGRRDVVASTRAALDYLAYLGSFFEGNWLLGIAAYDTGEGNVNAAIRKNIRDGKNTDFWSLPLAQETRDYIPRLLALATILAHPEKYPIDLPVIPNAPYLAQIDVGGQIDLRDAARLATMPLKNLKRLNPAYRQTTSGYGPSKLILPIENVAQFSENLARSPLYRNMNWAQYKIKDGDTLTTIAKQFNTTAAILRKVNPQLANNFKPGHSLIIPRSPQNLSEKILKSTSETYMVTDSHQSLMTNVLNSVKHHHRYKLQPGDTLYMVRKHDTIEKIAHHFHATPNVLLAINKIRFPLKMGDKLIIPTHSSASATNQYQLSPGDTIYMVRKNDTVEKIAAKFHTTPAAIRISNLLASNTIQEGDRLVVPAKMM